MSYECYMHYITYKEIRLGWQLEQYIDDDNDEMRFNWCTSWTIKDGLFSNFFSKLRGHIIMADILYDLS